MPELELPPPPTPPAHFDGVILLIKEVETPGDPDEVLRHGVVCFGIEVGVPLDEARHYVSAVAWNAEDRYFYPYVLEERRTEYEWGSSGTSLTWIVELISGLPQEAVYAGLGYAVSQLKGHFSRPSVIEPLTLEVALGKARAATGLLYEIDAAQLQHVGDGKDISTGSISIALRADDGRRFDATVSRVGDHYLATQVTLLPD